jgi:transposase
LNVVNLGTRKRYPIDISKEAFEEIRPLLESIREQTKPRTVDLYEVFCGVLYLLKSGCQWRMLPSEYPKWRTVHAFFTKWSEPGTDGFSVLERALKNVVGEARTRQRRKSSTSFLIVDAQGVKNADSARVKATTPARKFSGIKRHIAVDTQGLPHAIAVTTADVTDRKRTLLALGRCATDLRGGESTLADGGYVGQPFALAVEELLGAQVRIAKRSELHTFAVMPQRWVVERSFAWIEKCRRLWKSASANSIPACSSSTWPSSSFYPEDR